MVKDIYIIRHGETEYNQMGVVQGSGVDVGLNANGMQQASAFYRNYVNWNPHLVITSKLKRSKETVANFIEDGIPHLEMEALNEICWGVYEGRPSTEETRATYKALAKAWKSGRYDAKLEGGESIEELGIRQQAFIEKVPDLPGSRILVCSHGRAMRALLCVMLGAPYKQMDAYPHQNLSLYVVQFEAGRFRLLRHNDTDHLK